MTMGAWVHDFNLMNTECLQGKVQTFRAERDFSSRIMALRENFTEKHFMGKKSRILRAGEGFGNSLMWAKDSKKDQEEQMPQRWEVPRFLRNSVCDGDKAERTRLERATLWKGPSEEDCGPCVLGWGVAGCEQHRTRGQRPGISALVPVLSGKFRVFIK